MGAAMRPPRKPTGGKPTGSKRPPASRPFTERPARGAQRDAEGRPSTRGESRPQARGPQRDAAPARGEERRERPARSERPTRDERPRRSDRPARATGGPGQPARPQAGPSAPRVKRPPPPVRETEIAPQRIAKALARAGVGSRRDIERMIAEGRVAIDGEPLTSPALNIASLKGVTVDGQPVAGIAPAKLYRFHKPAGFLTTARDPAGRPTIMDILPADLPRVVPVGRLDMNTEGLLLLTNDGGLKRALELPSSGVPRTYRVRAYGEISQRVLESLMEGITIEGIHYGSIDANIERRTGRNLWLMITLKEGKNREIRRVLEHLGLQVSRLIRTSYGPIPLADLPPRMADEIPADLVAVLKKQLGS